MRKSQKIILCIATILPIIMYFLFVIMVVINALGMASWGVVPFERSPETYLLKFFIGYFTFILWYIALLIIYIMHIIKNRRLDGEKKALWAVVVFLGSVIAMIVYWVLYIWKLEEEMLETGSMKMMRKEE